MRVLFLCTGNATRSVLGAAALEARRPDLDVWSAGTLVIEGQPMSRRTRAAFEAIGVAPPAHRSRQADADLVGGADLVVTFEPHHLDWVRREVPASAHKTGSLPRLAKQLAPAGDLAVRLAELGLAGVEHEDWEEVVDPGGRDEDAFIACAHDIVGHIDVLAPKL